MLNMQSQVYAQRNDAYVFQHRVLPRLYYENPALLRIILRKPNAGKILAAYSRKIYEGIPNSQELNSVKRPLWRVDSLLQDGVIAYILTPPPPAESPLCYLIAVIYPVEGDTSKFFVLRKGFYTLEKNKLDPNYIPICSLVYTKEGYFHSNYGAFNSRNKVKFAQKAVLNSLGIKVLEKASSYSIPNTENEDN